VSDCPTASIKVKGLKVAYIFTLTTLLFSPSTPEGALKVTKAMTEV